MKKLLKGAMHGIARGVMVLLPSALLCAGGAALAWGIGLIFVPAGIIAAGLLAIAAGLLLILGGGDSHE